MDQNNILPALMAIFPTLFYSLIIFFMLPKKMVSWRRMRKYFGIGLASPLMVFFFYYLFPGAGSGGAFEILFFSVFFAALIEEISKYATFKWANHNRVSSKNDYPVATMIYSMSAAAGFAIVENFHYAMKFGEDVLLMRGVTANILHLLCGLMIGYFIAKSKMIKKPIIKTKIKLISKSLITTQRALIVSLGITFSATYHAFYNTNLYVSGYAGMSANEIMVCLFVLGIFTTYYMLRDLVQKSKEMKIDRYGES